MIRVTTRHPIRTILALLAVLWSWPSWAAAQAAPRPSSALAERNRFRARLEAIENVAEPNDDGTFELTPAQARRVAEMNCPWALAVAAMTPEERAAEIARARVDPDDPSLGYEERNAATSENTLLEELGLDRALERALDCRASLDRARVYLALGHDGGLRWLERAARDGERGVETLEATLSVPQRALYGVLREMRGDLSRARASSLEQLTTALGLLVGERCVSRAPGPAYLGGEEAPPGPVGGLALIACPTGRPGFHDAYDFAIVTLVARVGEDGARVVDRLRDIASHNASWFEGEGVRGARVEGSIVVMETELGSGEGYDGVDVDVARAGLLVCSGASGRCRRADLGSGPGRARWALVGTTLALIDASSFAVLGAVDVERWLAGEVALVTVPPRAEPPSPLTPGPATFAVADLSESEGCWFTVIDADGALNARERASARSAVVGSVPRGAIVHATEVATGWIRVAAPVAGWLHRGGLARTCVEAVAERLGGDDEASEDEEP
jgi:hypothetical protein